MMNDDDASMESTAHLPLRIDTAMWSRLRAIAKKVCSKNNDLSCSPSSMVQNVLAEALDMSKPPQGEKLLYFAIVKFKYLISDHFRAIKAVKRGSGKKPASLSAVGDPGRVTNFSEIDAAIARMDVATLLEKLERACGSNLYSRALLLKAEGMADHDIAEVLGVGETTLKKILSEGKRKISMWVDPELRNITKPKPKKGPRAPGSESASVAAVEDNA